MRVTDSVTGTLNVTLAVTVTLTVTVSLTVTVTVHLDKPPKSPEAQTSATFQAFFINENTSLGHKKLFTKLLRVYLNFQIQVIQQF